MTDFIITCPNCGQKNKIDNSGHGQPVCGSCWTQLEVPSQKNDTDQEYDYEQKNTKPKKETSSYEQVLKLFIVILVISCICLAFVLYYLYVNDNASVNNGSIAEPPKTNTTPPLKNKELHSFNSETEEKIEHTNEEKVQQVKHDKQLQNSSEQKSKQ